ncbi:hypothetical protein D9758_008171 [Tetrapyrgos nigripes]|uniref:Uncharacterized protein n=1 Tax=Tetrapyrgos nigripes TaxID=182062 RepID=A0A8H5GHC2_9AGAR|nr:hypothetical protein D9758_008171 [Tetrapyrgos nigripes]
MRGTGAKRVFSSLVWQSLYSFLTAPYSSYMGIFSNIRKFLCLGATEFTEAEDYELTDRQTEATAQTRFQGVNFLNTPTQVTTGSSDPRPPAQTSLRPNRSDAHSISSTGSLQVYNFNARTIYYNVYTHANNGEADYRATVDGHA